MEAMVVLVVGGRGIGGDSRLGDDVDGHWQRCGRVAAAAAQGTVSLWGFRSVGVPRCDVPEPSTETLWQPATAAEQSQHDD